MRYLDRNMNQGCSDQTRLKFVSVELTKIQEFRFFLWDREKLVNFRLNIMVSVEYLFINNFRGISTYYEYLQVCSLCSTSPNTLPQSRKISNHHKTCHISMTSKGRIDNIQLGVSWLNRAIVSESTTTLNLLIALSIKNLLGDFFAL